MSEKTIDSLVREINKDIGSNTISKLSSNDVDPIESISTGSIGLDKAIGIGGLPRGRITEIYGPESSGKTTLALSVIAQANKVGKQAAFIDMEHALDVSYAARLGVDVPNLLISQPDYGEQALEIARKLINSGIVDIVVVDSVAALVPKAELEGDIGESHMGLMARMMSQFMRMLNGDVRKTGAILIFINQLRMKMQTMPGASPEVTTGGNALKFYASCRLDVRRIGSVKRGEEAIGNQTRVRVVKNKMAAPFRVATFNIVYGEGIDAVGEVIDIAAESKLIEKGGAWFTVNGERLQGRDAVREYLIENPEIYDEIRSKCI